MPFAGCVGTLDQTVGQTTTLENAELVDCHFPDGGVGFGVRNRTATAKTLSVRIEHETGGVVYDETLELAASTDDSTGHIRRPEGVFPEPGRYVTSASAGEETATDTRNVATQCDRPVIYVTTDGVLIRSYGHG
jgi:hypothetical protein